jgi:hypothetical protein
LENLPPAPPLPNCFTGRLRVISTDSPDSPCGLQLFTTQGRFHPGTIAGLVVGAMGVFIFGLYLRAWLRERKALASQPGQDMIA